MATHNHVPAIREHGLQDDCERCSEHAEHPFSSLDDNNLTALAGRTKRWMEDETDSLPRSDTEECAMRYVERVIRDARVLRRLEML